MKEKFLKIQFLVYAVLLYLAASLLEGYLSGLKTFDIDGARIERTLADKETRIDTIISHIRREIKSGEKLVKDGSLWLLDEDLSYLKEEGFSVFVYENDTMRFWTDNTVSTDKVYSQSSINNRIGIFNNAWYEIRTFVDGDITYVGLVFIRSKYNLTNKYLHNDFLPEFNLGASVQISMIPLSYGFDIKDKDGRYIFSLVPTNSYDIDGDSFNLVGILFLFSLVMLLMYVLSVVDKLIQAPCNSLVITSIIVSVVSVRGLLLMLKFPTNIYSLDFFDPIYFSGQGLFTTIGDFIANIVVLFFVIVYIFRLVDYKNFKEWLLSQTIVRKCLVWLAMLTLYFVCFGYLCHVTVLLVGESRISFQLNNLVSLDIFSVSGIVVMVILTGTLLYTSVKLTEYFDYTLIKNLRKSVIIYILAVVVVFFVVWIFSSGLSAVTTAYALLMIGSAILMHYQKVEKVVYRYIFMLFLSAVAACTLISVTTQEKILRQCEDLVVLPSDTHDPIAELLLNDISARLSSDGMIGDFLRSADQTSRLSRLRDYIQHQYFNGYWSKYNLSIKVLFPDDGVLFSAIDDDFVHAVEERGEDVNGTGFYFIDNTDGTVSYYGPLKYRLRDNMCYLCVSLDSKPVPQELGYPELLMDDNIRRSDIDGYDYARYHGGRKISQNGKFSYDVSDMMFVRQFDDSKDTIKTMSADNYVHIVYHKGDNTVVLSRKQFTILDFVIQMAYLFVTFIFVMFCVISIKMVVTHNYKYSHQIKTRLIVSLSFIMMLSFVSICIITAYMNMHKFKLQNQESMEEKVRSVYMRLEQLSASDSLDFGVKWNPNKIGSMDEMLTRMSHVFFADINLYAVDGELIASSRPEVFKQGLISTRMNTVALQKFVINNKSSYSQDECIGNMSFASAYIPFYAGGDHPLAYINLPFFTRPEVLRSELSTLIVSIVNLYVVMLMISIGLVVIISERIVQPIKLIQSKMETIELGKSYEKIEYSNEDEIGQLVTEYNNMVDKLDESAKQLAKGERETAWREMAKQVAHEIKNPLTPMKLSIQFLTRSWANGNSDFESVLTKVSSTLVQQIDTLSSIATEFSSYAKLPQPKAQNLNLVEVLENVVLLYQTVENADVTSDFGGHTNVPAFVDKEQMTRVFVNIIKNATQAIPEGVRGKIHVSLDVKDDSKIVVRIADNGCGIPDEIREKLFTPNFTTKSSGSGLGLAMVRNMVVNANGDITFESEVGKGTTFIITLPLSQ